MTGQFTISGIAPALQNQTLVFRAQLLLVGRDDGDIVLGDPKTSARHLEITFNGKHVYFRDLDSTNGTFLDGERVGYGIWLPGTTLTLGHSQLTLVEVIPTRGGNRTQPLGAVGLSPRTQPMTAHELPAAAPKQPPQKNLAHSPGPQRDLPEAPLAPVPAPDELANRPPATIDSTVVPDADDGAQKEDEPIDPNFLGLPSSKPKKKLRKRLLLALPLVAALGAGGYFFATTRSPAPKEKVAAPFALTKPSETKMSFVWYAERDEKPEGGVSEARVKIAPNPTGKVSVGVQEQLAGGSGRQWRAAVWMAAFNASRVMKQPLSTYEFTVASDGHVDGPSAGMLTTVSMLALLRGKKLRKSTTVTGTINPDGTMGPVGGIEEKMSGAKKAGLKRFGYPTSSSSSEPSDDGKPPVDLAELAKSLELEAVELKDVYQAYTFVTGDELPRTEPILETSMALDADSRALLEKTVGSWRDWVSQEVAHLKDERSRLVPKSLYESLLKDVEQAYERAGSWEQQGRLAAALDSYATAAISVSIGRSINRAIEHMGRLRYKELLTLLRERRQTKDSVKNYRTDLMFRTDSKKRGSQINTAFSFGLYVDAETAIEIAETFFEDGEQLLEKCAASRHRCRPTQKLAEEIGQKVLSPLMFYDIAAISIAFAKDMAGLALDEGEAPAISPEKLNTLLGGYTSAATAVMENVESIITESAADEFGVTEGQMRGVLAKMEPNYLLASRASVVAARTVDEETDKPQEPLLRLAAAASAYIRGSQLMSKWYALEPQKGEDGRMEIGNEKALAAQLELAETSAREAAARSQSLNGFVPVAARFSYQAASALREGTQTEKLEALSYYWAASFWSELCATP